MLPFRRLPRSTHPVVLILGQIRDDVAAIGRAIKALPSMRDDLVSVHRHLHEIKEQLMADFSNLNAKVDQLAGALDTLESEWAELKDQLTNDTADQAAVDALTARVDSALSRVRGVDLVADQPAEEPAPGEGDQPQ